MSIITQAAEDAGKAQEKASSIQQQFLRDKWNELQGMQMPFIQQGQQAFGMYGNLTGASGAQAQQDALSKFQMSPQAQFGLEQQLKTMNQNASATGGIFGGNRLQQEAGTRTQAYQNDLANYLERLRSQAALGQQASGALGGVGTISGQGIAGAIGAGGDAQANAALMATQAQQGAASGASTIGGALLAAFSDERLKCSVEKIGSYGPIGIYRWAWNEIANNLGLFGKSIGHIAQEVKSIYPDLVDDRGDYMKVIYGDGRTMEHI